MSTPAMPLDSDYVFSPSLLEPVFLSLRDAHMLDAPTRVLSVHECVAQNAHAPSGDAAQVSPMAQAQVTRADTQPSASEKVYVLRPLHVGDLERGYLRVLEQLTQVGTITPAMFRSMQLYCCTVQFTVYSLQFTLPHSPYRLGCPRQKHSRLYHCLLPYPIFDFKENY